MVYMQGMDNSLHIKFYQKNNDFMREMEEMIMNDMRLFNVVGIDDLEGTVFARCTTLAKAVIAQDKLEKEGFEGMIDIVQDEIPIDVIEIDGELIEL